LSFEKHNIDWLEEIIAPAIDWFYASPADKDLLDRNASEQSIVANIYCKMNQLFTSSIMKNIALQHLRIDVEYNRNHLSYKEAYLKCGACGQESCLIKERGCQVRDIVPDILIHQRGTNNDNQVVIEIKKAFNIRTRELENDEAKLTYLTCQKPFMNENKDYRYRYGYYISLDSDGYSIDLYQDASRVNTQKRQEGSWCELWANKG
jgi:hypothetical protein